jgi:hypothetical protein
MGFPVITEPYNIQASTRKKVYRAARGAKGVKEHRYRTSKQHKTSIRNPNQARKHKQDKASQFARTSLADISLVLDFINQPRSNKSATRQHKCTRAQPLAARAYMNMTERASEREREGGGARVFSRGIRKGERRPG